MKKMHLTLMPWKWEGVVLVGGTGDDFKAWAKAYIDADVQAGAHSAGHAYVEYGKPFLLWIDSLKDIASLAHEALHVTCGILEGRGLTFNDGSEEAYTYAMEDIIRQVLAHKRWSLA